MDNNIEPHVIVKTCCL